MRLDKLLWGEDFCYRQYATPTAILQLIVTCRLIASVALSCYCSCNAHRPTLLAVVLTLHLSACLFFYMAFLDDLAPNTWVGVAGIEDAGLGTKYL